jgi:hypothetical protein
MRLIGYRPSVNSVLNSYFGSKIPVPTFNTKAFFSKIARIHIVVKKHQIFHTRRVKYLVILTIPELYFSTTLIRYL